MLPSIIVHVKPLNNFQAFSMDNVNVLCLLAAPETSNVPLYCGEVVLILLSCPRVEYFDQIEYPPKRIVQIFSVILFFLAEAVVKRPTRLLKGFGELQLVLKVQITM
jgi:hypothetical protein